MTESFTRRAAAEAIGVLAAGQWHDFWLYVVGPLVGAPLGAFAHQFVRGERTDGDSPVRLPA